MGGGKLFVVAKRHVGNYMAIFVIVIIVSTFNLTVKSTTLSGLYDGCGGVGYFYMGV